MPTNEERREVAENLRYMCAYGCRYKEQFYDLLVETVMGCEDFHDFADTACRLADLIEPEERACMRVRENARGNPKHFLIYVCSECHGAVVHDKYDPIYYCPNCGAKITGVEE